jgi:hypothetical protein
MVDNRLILVTGAAGQVGSVGRTVVGLLLDRGLPVRAMVRRDDVRAASLRAAGAQVWSATCSNRAMFIASSAAAAGSTLARGEGLLVVTSCVTQALDADACVQILRECGFVRTGGIVLINLLKIPDGLNADETERYFRKNGAELCTP